MLNVLEISVYLVLLMMIKQNAVQTAKVYSKGSNIGAVNLPTWGLNSLCTGGTFPGVIGSDSDVAQLKSASYLCGDVTSAYTGCALAIAPAATLGNWLVNYSPASTYLQGKTILYMGGTTAVNAAPDMASFKCLVVGADTTDIYITAVSDCTSVPLLCQNYDESTSTTSTTTTTTTATTTETNAVNFIIGLFDYILRWVLSDNGLR